MTPDDATPIQTCPVCLRSPLPVYKYNKARTTLIQRNFTGSHGLNPAAYWKVLQTLQEVIEEVKSAGDNRPIVLDGQWLSYALAMEAEALTPSERT